MHKNSDSLICHYHRCDTITWLHVRTILDKLLLSRLYAGTNSFSFHLDDHSFEVIRDFTEQMDTAYLHPRRDSLHLSLIRDRYNWLTHSRLLAGRESTLA